MIYDENQGIFSIVGERASGHIIDRLIRLSDPNHVVTIPGWNEIDLYDFIKSALTKDVFSTHINSGYFHFRDESGESLKKVEKKYDADKRLFIEDFNNPIARAVLGFYLKNKDTAAPNDLFLELSKNRAYGFILLNVHSADIDVKLGETSENSHFIIRYNENVGNTQSGWKKRLEYITQIYEGQGFESEQKGGYLHMHYPSLPSGKAANHIINEAMRGLVSTTHLNLSFEEFPHTLDEAVQVFNSGITNVYDHIERLPEVKAVRLKQRQANKRLQGLILDQSKE